MIKWGLISSIQRARIKKNAFRLGESFFTTYTKVREPPQSGILLLLKQQQDVINQLNLGAQQPCRMD
ncbi:hypothetical protein BMF90_12940 [Serratia sp. OLHL2]|nr:hypothetical protein BMF85_14790 [Serratia sp. OLCL1]PII64083.1 hypothetical protein BMF90_12940 [Serratia sp. OLHL2]PIJ20333.1 hypothetical protein BVV03_13825 [Serratia sp. OSPLW9]PIJ34254.1 hypothetical protein BOM26_11975 [Serratia sp. OPWLW3]PIJ42058.1 hypothetical protein BOM25_14670 [Serratia sp. OPWLW2]PIJ71122.1 hypothetical protein BK415_18325 [Serratia sp. OLMTLW26]